MGLLGSNAAIVPSPAFGDRIDVSKVDQKLSLANGMTAGYGVEDNKFDNWPVASPGQYGDWPLQPKRVGFLRNIGGVVPGPSNNSTGQYTLYFMYNPTEVDVSWSTNPGSYAPLYLYGPDYSDAISQIKQYGNQGTFSQTQIPGFTQSQQVAWTLYFDRTYDMMYGVGGTAAPDVNSAQADRGVLKDVAALYNLMGAFITDAAVPISVPCKVVFGQNSAGQLWGFTGYIQSLTVKYGVFRHDMIPSMAQVDLTMTCTYVSDSANPGASNPTLPGTNVQTQNVVPNGGANNTTAPGATTYSSAYGPPPGKKNVVAPSQTLNTKQKNQGPFGNDYYTTGQPQTPSTPFGQATPPGPA